MELRFPFDAYLVDQIKLHIPAHARTYSPETKAWTVTPAYAGIALRLMYQVFGDIEIEDAKQAGPTFDHSGDSREAAFAVLHLKPSAPPELVAAAHKVLARLHHPDAGGDTVTMQQINAAVDVIGGTR